MSHEPPRITWSGVVWTDVRPAASLMRDATGDDGAHACALLNCDECDWEEMAMGLVMKDAKGVKCPHCGVVNVLSATPVTMTLAGGTETVYQGGIELLPGAPGKIRCACGEYLPLASEAEKGQGDVNQAQPKPATTATPAPQTKEVDPRRRHGQGPPATTKQPAPDPRRQRPQ